MEPIIINLIFLGYVLWHLNFRIFVLDYVVNVPLPLIVFYLLFLQNIMIDKNVLTHILEDKSLAKALLYFDI